MIHNVTGDILLSKAQLTAHGIAPNDHFDSGLALALRERWPGMVKDFRHWAKNEHPKAGEIWVWSGPDQDGTKSIANLLTQDGEHHHGARPGKATLSHVHNALKALAAYCEDNAIQSLALPRVATGVGGGLLQFHPLVIDGETTLDGHPCVSVLDDVAKVQGCG